MVRKTNQSPFHRPSKLRHESLVCLGVLLRRFMPVEEGQRRRGGEIERIRAPLPRRSYAVDIYRRGGDGAGDRELTLCTAVALREAGRREGEAK